MSEIKAGAVLNYIRLFISLGVGFFLSPFILASLGKAEYGVYTIAGSIVSWLALCDFGLSASATKFLSEYQAKGDARGEARYLGNAAVLFSIIGGFVLVAGLVIYPFLEAFFPKFTAGELHLYKILYLMTLFNTALMFPLRSLGGIANARQKFKVPGIAGVVFSVSSVVATVAVLLLGYKSIVLTATSIVLGILNMAWNVYYCFVSLKARIIFSGVDIPLCKRVFSFSVWMFLDQLINMFNTGSSNFIVGMTCGASEVSVYSYGLRMFVYFAMLSSCTSSIFLPKVVNMVVKGASNEEQTDMMIRVGRIQLIVLYAAIFGIVFFGREFFHLWLGKTLGDRTHDCWFVAISIIIPYGFPLLQTLGWQILQARNAMKFRVVVLGVTSFLFLLLGYYLSLNFGIKALALATAGSIIAGQGLIVNWFYWKRLGLEMPRFFKETLSRIWIWGPLLCIGCIALNALLPVGEWNAFFLKIALFVFIYAIVILSLYANNGEKRMLLPLLKR